MVKKTVKVHRMTIEKDMMEIFEDINILVYDLTFEVIDPRGQTEEGTGSGVNKEVFCLFFQHFVQSNLIGFQEKVPCIRHDTAKIQWCTIVRFLLYSFRVGYYPLQISFAFFVSILFGDDAVTEQILMDSFKHYVTVDEKVTIEESLTNYSMSEDLLDLLSSYKCYKNPRAEIMKEIFLEIGHQELIQKPKYVANCFVEEFQKASLPSEFNSITSLRSFYNQRIPSAKKIINSLVCTTKDENEKLVLDHLTRYIKSLGETQLKNFLFFVTGGDLMPSSDILLTFVPNQHPRAPIARTCTPMLEISDQYTSFNDLAKEFGSILSDSNSFLFSFV